MSDLSPAASAASRMQCLFWNDTNHDGELMNGIIPSRLPFKGGRVSRGGRNILPTLGVLGLPLLGNQVYGPQPTFKYPLLREFDGGRGGAGRGIRVGTQGTQGTQGT